ncbi:MAG: hypothetical protein FJW27_12700 [Acidimicrobiia bacterium]|nr:hypothetical protein [Acidimicrobiia bacterium]
MVTRIFNIIGWIGTALVVFAVLVRINVIPIDQQWSVRLAIAGLVAMVAYMATQWREIAAMFSTRQARYWFMTIVGVIVASAVFVAVNYISSRRNYRWDLTSNQQFSLSDQTKNVLAKLDAPLQIQVFDRDFQQHRDRLREYEYVSKQLTTEYIDPDRQRTAAQQAGIQQYGTYVIKYKDRTERVTSSTEQDITNGIIKVVSGETRKVYFTQGHGEKDPTSMERTGFNGIGDALKRENYTVERLALAQTGSVPNDASIVVVAGPVNDFFPPEIEALEKFLDTQGKLLLMLDPEIKPDSPPLTNLVALAKDWGIEVGANVVIDTSGMGRMFGSDASSPVALTYPPHAITEGFNNMITLYPLARSVNPASGGTNGRTAQSFIETSAASWAERDMTSLSTGAGMDEATGDKAGPISLAAAVAVPASTPADAKPEDAKKEDTPKREARMAVVGDSDFSANFALGVQGNRDMFMNIVGWLSQQENLISIRPREPSDRRLSLTVTQQIWVILTAMIVVPGAVFSAGVYSWWRRRK